ncbi:protein mono-ADP-ribosyltransferase PARP12 [Antennarius striatus]|uniref:protein mono-ADP-ribosyltransferase PARP12 n=1 Tax=Antennarius striatus TaxID=241820 RepID=UPI0035B2EB7F
MVSHISRFIIKLLSDNQGSLDYRRLDEELSKSFTVAEQLLQRFYSESGWVAIQEGTQEALPGRTIRPDSVVVAKTSLRLCQQKGCLRCDKLHLCRYLVCGGCTFGTRCKNPHSLTSPHNEELLSRYDLQYLTENQLFQLLLQNDPYILPEVCPHYNKGDGLHGSCRFKTYCTKLHVCQHYLQGDCSFGSSCKRTHHFDGQDMKIFQGFSQENIENLFKSYRNKLIIMAQQGARVAGDFDPATQQFSSCIPGLLTDDANKGEICLYFIRKNCNKERCNYVHWPLPYRWQILNCDFVTWVDLPNMEDIEKAFCDPQKDVHSSPSSVMQSVNFMTMTYGESPVRRLSTPSSVTKPAHFILTTKWCWYWKDNSGTWLEFGKNADDTPASVTSETLEKMYSLDREDEVEVGVGSQQCIFRFTDSLTAQMYQLNVNNNTRRDIRRRPCFVSAQYVELVLKSASSHSSSSSTSEIFPSHWDKNSLPNIGYKLVPLSKSGNEYNMIEVLFKHTMSRSRINNIQRIQNPSLWEVFQWQKEHMMKRKGGKEVNQLHLFHGSNEPLIEAICEHNFDWRICGGYGMQYGKGSYFARDASCADRYSSSNNSQNKFMFVALVLVGDYTVGNSSFVRPPPKVDGSTYYDSCVDSETDPSIHVVYDKQQIYPEYLINYS